MPSSRLPKALGSHTGLRIPTADGILTFLLDQPDLPELITRLPAATLGSLVREVGLEDAGEFLALATPAQIEQVLDEDVWAAPAPGEAEVFEPSRFALWLEVLVGSGIDAGITRVRALDESFLAMALASLLRVWDFDALQLELGDDPEEREAFEKALDSLPQQEFDSYLLVGRHEEAWDALIEVLSRLYQEDYPLFDRLMRRVAKATGAAVENEGSNAEVLREDEALYEEAAAEREERRTRGGFVEPRAAKALLSVIRNETPQSVLQENETPIVIDSYLGYLRSPEAAHAADEGPRGVSPLEDRNLGLRHWLHRVMESAQVAPTGRLGRTAKLTAAMRTLWEQAPSAFDRRKVELAFLANVLMAGETKKERPRRFSEAAATAVSACERGLAWLHEQDPARATSVLHETDAMITLFRLGEALGAREKS